MKKFDVGIIGAGAVGLAIARIFAENGQKVVVFERHVGVGREISHRNSAVIHAGIYYPTDSLKAILCLRGKALLEQFCFAHAVPYKRCGKLIVATSSEQSLPLIKLYEQGKKNGVTDLTWLEQDQIQKKEPLIKACTAIYSPATGVIDGKKFIAALYAECLRLGISFQFECETKTIEKISAGEFNITTVAQDEHYRCQQLINAGGLNAMNIAHQVAEIRTAAIPTLFLAKGNYFKTTKRSPLSTLVYPLPDNGGLGIHATTTIQGELLFGPDVEWIDEINYNVSCERENLFRQAIQCYWPDFNAELQPALVGIRPKLSRDGSNDFKIQLAAEHGVAGLINLFGIESPGLTACFALAEEVWRSAAA